MKKCKIIKDGYQHWYKMNNSETAEGFCFQCEENGRVMTEQMSHAARENYEKCKNGILDVKDMGVVDRHIVVPDD